MKNIAIVGNIVIFLQSSDHYLMIICDCLMQTSIDYLMIIYCYYYFLY